MTRLLCSLFSGTTKGITNVLLYTYNIPCVYCGPKIVDIKKAIETARGLPGIPFTVVYSVEFGKPADMAKTRKDLKAAGIILNNLQ